jgi:hypothetical protein
MFNSIKVIVLGVLFALLTTLIAAIIAKGAGFQPNDVVALQVKNTTGAVELDEYSPSGLQTSPLNVVSIPSSGSDKLTVSGSPHEGSLKLSGDSNYLTLAGNGANFNTSVVGRVSVNDGTVDLSTKIATSATTFFGAITSNGTDIWIQASSGVHYTTLGSSTTTVINHPYMAGGAVGIFGGQLYSTIEDSSPNVLVSVGNGLPKVPSPETPLPGTVHTNHETNDFWFRDASTLYITGLSFDSHPGIQKWAFDGTIWNYQYNLLTSQIGNLSGWVDPSGNTVLFATSGMTNNNLLRVVDGGSQALSTSSILATAATGTGFHGVAFISVPEPASFVLIALGVSAVFVLARRRKVVAKIRH